jgi:GAF domain-containing protein
MHGRGDGQVSTVVERPSDLQALLKSGAWGFPFRTELSLVPLIAFWTRKAATGSSSTQVAFARLVETELVGAPELQASITDQAVLDRHRELIATLMTVVFPPAFWEQEYGAALLPFQLQRFHATPSFERLLMGPDGRLQGRISVDAATMLSARALFGYSLVLGRAYGIRSEFDIPIVLTIADPDTGLDRHFRLQFDPRFVEVVPRGPVAPLDDETRQRIHRSLNDPKALGTLLPTQDFLLRGFTVLRACEVTDQEVISSLKRDLIDRESIISAARFDALQAKLRTLFRRPRLHLGLAAIDGDQVLKINSGARMEHACIFADSNHKNVSEFRDSCYDKAVQAGRPIVIEDLADCCDATDVEREIQRVGFRNLLVAPLYYQDELIGMLDLASTEPGDLDASHLPKLEEVLPLFSMAVRRSKDEFESRIQGFIKEQWTAIHPSVEWRFRRAVLTTLERQRSQGGASEIEPIVFPDVYPLYGLSDIRGSSTQRALAIQSDLLRQLQLARDVLRTAHDARPLPALDQLAYRIDRHMGQVEVGLRSGDENTLIAFLRTDIEPHFDHLHGFGPAVAARVEAYRASLEPGLGTVYERRRAFEDSVTLVTETISSYLDLEEQAAQGIVPHYFEKQKSDGIDYGIYVGASLLEDGRFDPLHLKSLRLWQIMVTCGVAVRTARLKGRLAIPLEVTHLVLAHHAPLSIRFRFDEKRFDVDGAYNMRYQIVKKRIDKAVIRDTNERLTQPGQIAIVYSQPLEAAEYRDYLDYLHHRGYVAAEVEDVELEELQGVRGLRALRVAVNVDAEIPEPGSSLRELSSAAGG